MRIWREGHTVPPRPLRAMLLNKSSAIEEAESGNSGGSITLHSAPVEAGAQCAGCGAKNNRVRLGSLRPANDTARKLTVCKNKKGKKEKRKAKILALFGYIFSSSFHFSVFSTRFMKCIIFIKC